MPRFCYTTSILTYLNALIMLFRKIARMSSFWSVFFIIGLTLLTPFLDDGGERDEEIVISPYSFDRGGPFEIEAGVSAALAAGLVYPQRADREETLAFVSNEGAFLIASSLPGGKNTTGRNTAERTDSFFTLPAKGWNWGELHKENAIDIADQCGSPIYAAAEGLVIETIGNDLWNDGYGNYVVLEHPTGVKTRYAHTKENVVSVGNYVSQGEEIASIGNTGKSHGPSGCHLHFEVLGAKNPFAIR